MNRHSLAAGMLAASLLLVTFRLPGAQTEQEAARARPDPPVIDARGYREALARHAGKPVMVNFWATWCEPCREEYPVVVELAKKYAPKGLVVMGVSFDDDGEIALVRRFLARMNPPFANYRMKQGIQETFVKSVDAGWRGSIPATFFYDGMGRQAARRTGQQTRADFEKAIEALLGDRQ